MVMKKNLNSNVPIVIANSSKLEELFKPGFCYRIGSTIYTVTSDISEGIGIQLRRIITSEGGVEDATVETIKKDLQEHDAHVLDVDEKYVIKEEEDKEDKSE
jgi:hypothetical protein